MIDLIMIQRIQTVYLFLSALFTALLLFLPLAVGVTVSGGPVRATLWGWTDPASADSLSSGAVHWIAGGLSVLVLALALVTIFGFRNRPLQKKVVHRAGRSAARRLRAAGLVSGQLRRSAFCMEPFRRLGLSRRIADPDAAGHAGNLQGRAAGPLARPDSVISKRAPGRFFRSGCACRRSSCVPRVGIVRICGRCLGAGAAMRLRLA